MSTHLNSIAEFSFSTNLNPILWVVGGVTILAVLFLLTFLVVISIIMESLTESEKFV
jgi:hypothetical protein